LASPALRRLIADNAVLWAGEAEVIRTYWDSPVRTRETDRTWIFHQAYKEFWDGFAPAARTLAEGWEQVDEGWPRAEALGAAAVARDELAHYAAFADLYEWVRDPEGPPLSPTALRERGNWPENKALGRLRAAHCEAWGPLGARAQQLTEGGYVVLYREGSALVERGGLDGAIAAACRVVYEDEIDHMISGLAGIEEAGLSEADWDCLAELTTAQCRQRIRMRDAQFGHPVAPARLQALLEGAVEPQAFDWKRAGL